MKDPIRIREFMVMTDADLSMPIDNDGRSSLSYLHGHHYWNSLTRDAKSYLPDITLPDLKGVVGTLFRLPDNIISGGENVLRTIANKELPANTFDSQENLAAVTEQLINDAEINLGLRQEIDPNMIEGLSYGSPDQQAMSDKGRSETTLLQDANYTFNRKILDTINDFKTNDNNLLTTTYNNIIGKKDDDKEEKDESVEEEIDLEEVLKALTEEEDEQKETNEVSKLQSELDEHRNVVKYLRSKLNEVNLLNAKLLFTNKLFRSYGLSNEQKMKVVETFDRAHNLREVKLVYSTLAESFGSKNTKTEIKESKGKASKAVASTKSKKQEVIAEGHEMRDRFKKLAGIL